MSIVERRRRVRLGILSGTLCEIVRKPKQTVELRDGERKLGEIEVDVLGIPDELEEVVGDEFDLCEDLLPPGPEVLYVPNVFDDLLVGERAHRIRAVAILGESLHVDGVFPKKSYPEVTPIVIGSARPGAGLRGRRT